MDLRQALLSVGNGGGAVAGHRGRSNIVFPNPKTTNPARNAGGDGVVGTSLHRFLLRFRLRWVTSGTSVGTSTGSDGSGALACRLEWRSIHTQNPRQTAVMASTAIVAGSIVFSSCFDSLKPCPAIYKLFCVVARGDLPRPFVLSPCSLRSL